MNIDNYLSNLSTDQKTVLAVILILSVPLTIGIMCATYYNTMVDTAKVKQFDNSEFITKLRTITELHK